MKSATYQYGVPINESLLCLADVFLADTPKSAIKTTDGDAEIDY